MVFAYSVKIPKSRIAVLIGKKGATKKEIEEVCNTKIDVDSESGEIIVEGEDALKLYACKEIITAIGRGFNPEFARLLLKPDYSMELIEINDFAGSKNSQMRLKGRVIGQEGKSRKFIEELTGTFMVVQGKTICIVGEVQRVLYAKRAVEQLLKGGSHKNTYRWLENMMKELRTREFMEKQHFSPELD